MPNEQNKKKQPEHIVVKQMYADAQHWLNVSQLLC